MAGDVETKIKIAELISSDLSFSVEQKKLICHLCCFLIRWKHIFLNVGCYDDALKVVLLL
jgi:hypothetical protein